MPQIQFGGIASGLDTAAIIDAMVGVSRAPISRLKSKQSTYQAQISVLSDIINRLSTLSSETKDFDTLTEFRSYKATSSDESKLKVSASSTANAGSYKIDVNALAESERTYSDAFASNDTTGAGFGSGTLTIQVGSDPAVNIPIDDATQTLEDVAGDINSSGANVNASVVFDGTNYRLLVQGKDTGAANAITFTESAGLVLNLDEVANEAQAASDASITLDGLTITSETNQISGALPGITFDLQDVTASSVTVRVDADLDTIETKLKEFVTAYNAVMTRINGEFTFSGEASQTKLSGDSALRSVKMQLQSVISSAIPASGAFGSLAEIGFSTERDGTLTIDSAKLRDALSQDMDGVAELFTLDNGTDKGVALQFADIVERYTEEPDGILRSKSKSLTSNIDQINKQIADLELRADSYEQSLVRQFAALETLMSEMQTQSSFLAQSTL